MVWAAGRCGDAWRRVELVLCRFVSKHGMNIPFAMQDPDHAKLFLREKIIDANGWKATHGPGAETDQGWVRENPWAFDARMTM